MITSINEWKIINERFEDESKLINIVNMSQLDWKQLQEEIINDCFPNNNNESKKLIPLKVEISNNKSSAASFNCKYRYDNDKLTLFNKRFRFNKFIKWDKEKLRNVMAHEMIHYYLTINGHVRHNHNYLFKNEMNRINNLNKGYIISIYDDEFILKDTEANKITNYFYIFWDKHGGYYNYTTNDKHKFDNDNDWIHHLINVDDIEVYAIPQHIQVKYGLKNMRSKKLVRYKKNFIDELINMEGVNQL